MAKTRAVARNKKHASPDDDRIAVIVNSVGSSTGKQRSTSESRNSRGLSNALRSNNKGRGSASRDNLPGTQLAVPSSSEVSTGGASLSRIPPAIRQSSRLDHVSNGKRKATASEDAYAIQIFPEKASLLSSRNARNSSKRYKVDIGGGQSSSLPTNLSDQASLPGQSSSKMQQRSSNSLSNSTEAEMGQFKRRQGKKTVRQGNGGESTIGTHEAPAEGESSQEGSQDASSDMVEEHREGHEIAVNGGDQGVEVDGMPEENQGDDAEGMEEQDHEFLANPASIHMKIPSRQASNNPVPQADGGGNPTPAARVQTRQRLPSANDEAGTDEGDVEDELPPGTIRLRPAEESRELHVLMRSLVKQMMDNSRHVGQTCVDGTWEVVEEKDICRTIEGKRLERRLDKLTIHYGTLKDIRRAKRSEHVVQGKISSVVDEVGKEADRILKERLGKPRGGDTEFDAQRTLAMVTDLYFRLIKRLVAALKLGVEVEMLYESFEDKAFREVYALFNVLTKLSETALAQPSHVQPTFVPGKPRYQVLTPMRLVLKNARKIRNEMKGRLPVITTQENFRRDKGHEEAAQRKFEEDEAERKRQKRELYRIQRAQLEAVLNGRWDGPFPPARESPELGGSQRAWRGQVQAEPDEEGFRYLSEESSEPDDHFAGAEEDVDNRIDYRNPERVQVFGKDNIRYANIPRPWTDGEKAHFIDVMKVEKGPDRYVNLARDLDRSGEEIFALAKDLQEAMDAAHEKGRFNEPCDNWTYEIYVRKRAAAGGPGD